MQASSPVVPPHLRRFVVEQDYSQYNAVDQAVWRFVLLQTYARLVHTAHPAYREGLAATGISVERIPSIAQMNEKLALFGWGAVCVDGFIPPRVFQEFQARALLPIAADIRTRQHLVYTPAPDIIHEAAGHAPILTNPVYAAYLRSVGELGQHAFTLPEEERIYQAIYALSEVKENPARGEPEVRAAEAELAHALASAPEVSEATRASRLYWWTAEYGLVGSVEDYRLYGAGLLSSLWESHSCHDPSVRKYVLTESCTEVAYDITRPQPQLFVAKSFDALHDVLADVRSGFASTVGGSLALRRARDSRELASFSFSSGACAIGVLQNVGPSMETPAFLELTGPCALAFEQGIGPQHGPEVHSDGLIVLLGPLADGRTLERATERDLDQNTSDSGRLRLRYASGADVEGRLLRCERAADGAIRALTLADARLRCPDEPERALAEYTLLAAGSFVTARAGVTEGAYFRETEAPRLSVPRPREFSRSERALLGLYERSELAHRSPAGVRQEFPEVHQCLARNYPTEWLLRWNLLETLTKLGIGGELAATLQRELELLETHYQGREPITSGLKYLTALKRH